MTRPSQYIHGTDPEEQRRLSLLNDVLNQSSLERLGLGGTERILEVGSGLGQFARAMAKRVPNGKVLGIERSPEQLAEAIRLAREAGEEQYVEFRRGDALDLPLRASEAGSFDLVHARFLLEHLNDPLKAVQQMMRAVRPGGRLILEDDDHDTLRMWPEPPGFQPLWVAYMRTYDRLGNDPFVGRRLISLLHQAGAIELRNACVFFGTCAGSPSFHAWLQNLVKLFLGAKKPIVEGGLLVEDAFDQTIEALAEWGDRPDSACWYQVAWAEGKRAL